MFSPMLDPASLEKSTLWFRLPNDIFYRGYIANFIPSISDLPDCFNYKIAENSSYKFVVIP